MWPLGPGTTRMGMPRCLPWTLVVSMHPVQYLFRGRFSFLSVAASTGYLTRCRFVLPLQIGRTAVRAMLGVGSSTVLPQDAQLEHRVFAA